jgi:hypothetical protein
MSGRKSRSPPTEKSDFCNELVLIHLRHTRKHISKRKEVHFISHSFTSSFVSSYRFDTQSSSSLSSFFFFFSYLSPTIFIAALSLNPLAVSMSSEPSAAFGLKEKRIFAARFELRKKTLPL